MNYKLANHCLTTKQVHLKHLDGRIEEVPENFFFSMRNCHCLLKVYYIVQVPYFCLPANELVDVIAPSCYRCVNFPG